ncbi:curved DNA-binding protein [Parelusimicrobium proximum]|uniref:DnaJ C-terminal domain-containing protein n=1 Tax=Parelusimicrobium proximum TaxID=3228953 RepID=UPI003D17B359
MAEYKDYYKILGVGKTAGEDEIKKAFKSLARKYHPDMHKDADKAAMTEKFKDVNEAYEVLSDKEKRKVYDQLGKQGYQSYSTGARPNAGGYQGGGYGGGAQSYYGGGSQGQQAGGFNFHNTGGFDAGDFSDFFQSIFGGGFGGFGGGGGSSFSSAFGGGAGPSGRSSADTEAELSLSLEDVYNGGQMRLALPNGKNITVKIPKGVSEGQKIKLKGQGNQTRNGAGDLYLTIKLKPHPLFKVEDQNLFASVAVYPWTAALGGTIQVPALDGNTKIKIPAGTHNGKRLKLSGKGLGKSGSLFIEIKIDIPADLTKEQKDLFMQLAKADKTNR